MVICIRSADSHGAFFNVQIFCVIELGLPFIPIGENVNLHITQVLIQLIDTSNPTKRRKNPFKFGIVPQTKKCNKKQNTIVNSTEQSLSRTLQTIPGTGEKKSQLLLQKFGSISEISLQSAETLAKVVGVSTATSVYSFFNS